jgi:predicted DNA-binding transcriptional regulator AlpA
MPRFQRRRRQSIHEAKRPTIEPPMDQPTPKTDAMDSTLLVTMTRGDLRELIRFEVQVAKAAQHVDDRLLDAAEAAKVLSVSEDWLYRNAKKLPFTRKLGPKMLRFSYKGIVKWLESRKVN